jgi:predicted permease
VRLALGAKRARLMRQLLTESAMMAASGAALGLLLARWLLKLQPAFMPPMGVDIGLDLRLDAPVIVFTLAVSALAVLVFGLVPALQASKTSLVPALKSGGEGASGPARRLTLRNGIVLGEIALSVVLLTASGLLLRSLLYSRGIHLGFDAQKNLVFFDLEPNIADYTVERSLAYFELIRETVGGLPGVRHVTYARRMLLSDSGGGATQHVAIPGVELPQGQRSIPIKFNAVGPGYFQTVGTHILDGRDFTAADGPGAAKVVLISETMGRRFWPGRDAIGRHIVAEGKDCQIVGVVEDAKINDVHEAPEPYIYFRFAQSGTDWGTLIVDTAGDPRALTGMIRAAIRRVDQNVPVSVRTLHFLMQEAYWSDQTAAGFVGGLSALGMFLASVGLYGVIAYLVNRRRHEIGIRMALGAEGRDVLRLILRQGLRLAAIGTGAGLAASFAVTRLMSNLLYGVKPTDPLAFAASSLIAIVVALTASYVPALRAARVEPVVALRCE